jgi:phage terminase small subunit
MAVARSHQIPCRPVEVNARQKAFADYYIECGNASESARKAGYNAKRTDEAGRQLLRNTEVAQYIKERMDALDKERIASADEVMQFYSDVIRGKIKDQFGLDASLNDRIKAADSLMKRYNIAEDKLRATQEKLAEVLKGLHDASMDSKAE